MSIPILFGMRATKRKISNRTGSAGSPRKIGSENGIKDPRPGSNILVALGGKPMRLRRPRSSQVPECPACLPLTRKSVGRLHSTACTISWDGSKSDAPLPLYAASLSRPGSTGPEPVWSPEARQIPINSCRRLIWMAIAAVVV